MRIIHICQRDDPDTGGSLRVAEALAREQQAAGLEVWLLFLYGGPGYISSRFLGKTICLGLHSSSEALRGIPALRRAVRRVEPDIIHSHDGIIWPRLAFLRLRIPLLMHSHLPALEPRNPKEWLGWALVRRTTDILVGISWHTIESWEGAGFPRQRIRYVPNGVDLQRFCPVDGEAKAALRRKLSLPSGKRILLWVGRLHRSMKGSDRIEHMAAMLPENTVLVVVGNGPEFRPMLSRCAEWIDSGRMVMAGSVCSPEEYYQAADAFLFTSYHEPFGLVLLEAVACGLPVLAFPLTGGGGASMLLEEFDAVRIPDNASVAEVRSALDSLYGKMAGGRLLRERAETRYAWSGLSRQVVGVYREILEPCAFPSPRILHICQRDDLSTGGATRIAFDLVVGQRNLGADSHLLFLYGSPGELGAQLPRSCTHYLGLHSASEVLPKGGWRMKRLLHRLRPGIVHHHDMLSWPQFMHLAKHPCRIVYHTHLDYRPPSGWKARMAWWMVRRNSDVLITPSSYGRERLAESGIPGAQVAVVPNGTKRSTEAEDRESIQNDLREKHALEAGCIVLGWGGRLHCATKGTDDFVRLFNHLPDHFVGVVAGHGPDEAMLRELVGELGLSRRIFFHGLEQDMPRFYRALDGFVLTSQFESFGLVVIEALINRVPVFSFPVAGGINDLFGLPAVAVAPERSLEAMGSMIQNAFADTGTLRESVVDAEREVEERYSIGRMATETLKLYDRLLKA